MSEKIKKLEDHPFFQCPNCGYMTFSLSGDKVGKQTKYRCSDCKKYFKWDEWREVTKNVTAFKCPRCGKYVRDTSENWICSGSNRELFCPFCHVNEGIHRNLALVAINGIHVSKFSKVNPKVLSRSQKLGNEIYVFKARTTRDRYVLRWLNTKAQDEEMSFRAVRKSDAYLLLSPTKYLGYLAWNYERDKPVMRQLFIVKDERRKGYATMLVQHFVKENCKLEDEILFDVESPNEASIKLFVKLGYIKVKENKITETRIGYVQGF